MKKIFKNNSSWDKKSFLEFFKVYFSVNWLVKTSKKPFLSHEYKLFYFLGFLVVTFRANISFAQTDGGLVNCDGVTVPCDFNKFVELINKVLKMVLFDFTMPLTVVLFLYAGYLLMTSGGDPGKVKQAKNIFINVLKGFAIALTAYLMVKLFLDIVGFKDQTGLIGN